VDAANTARVRHISLSEVERERVDAPSEEAGESRERRESLEGDKKPMGVSIESAAAMHRHNTDSLVEQSLEAEAQSKKRTFSEGCRGRRENSRRAKGFGDESRLLTRGRLRRA